jgi:putative transposase
MKYEFMQTYEQRFSIAKMSRVLSISRSGYYKFMKAIPSRRCHEDKQLIAKIQAIHNISRQTYGSPRICAELREGGEVCSRRRVCRLMRQAGIAAKMKRRFKVTTRVNSNDKAAPNLLQQNFTAQKPNQRWMADFTYVATQEGWLYVAAILDLFSRRIVGLAMSDRMTTDLVLKALWQAVTHRQPPPQDSCTTLIEGANTPVMISNTNSRGTI